MRTRQGMRRLSALVSAAATMTSVRTEVPQGTKDGNTIRPSMALLGQGWKDSVHTAQTYLTPSLLQFSHSS